MLPDATDEKKRPKIRRRSSKHSSGGVDAFLKKKEQLEAAQTRLVRAQRRMDRIRTKIRSKGGYEPDSLLFLSDGADNDLLSYIMGFLTVEEIVRSEMVCHTLRASARHSWEELGRRCNSGIRNGIHHLHHSAQVSREIVIRNHLASTYDEEEYDDEVLDADDIYEPPRQTADNNFNRGEVQNRYPYQYSYVSSDQNKPPAFCTRYQRHMNFASIFLFIMGSLLYLVCSIHQYQWSQTLLELPEWLRGADDDDVWMRYRLEEQYGKGSLSSVENRRFSRGERRRLQREQLPRGQDHGVNRCNKNNARHLHTPEEQYYDLDWACLPPAIRDAYTVLGYTEAAWDEGEEVETGHFDWEELTPVMQEAALFIGYTEMFWNGFNEPITIMRNLRRRQNSETWQSSTAVTTISATAPHSLKMSATFGIAPSISPSDIPRLEQYPSSLRTATVAPSSALSGSPSLEPTTSFQPSKSVAPFRGPIATPPPTMKFWMLGSPFAAPSVSPIVRPSVEPSYSPTKFISSSPSVYPSLIPSKTSSMPSGTTGLIHSIVLSDNTSGTPGELYEDKWWGDLPPKIQEAYKVLGYNETLWDASISPPSENMTWIELSPEMQEAASFIGYSQNTWDVVEGAVNIYDTDTSNNTDSDLPADTKHFEDYYWNELLPDVKEAAQILGYDQNRWDNGGVTWSDSKYWDELPLEAQEAASVFGFDEMAWNADRDSELEILLTAAGGEFISSDDDYVFQLKGSDVWVSEYQILYFFASVCFVFTGLFDLAQEKVPFHAFMALAGIFGVASSVYVEVNVDLSNALDSVSVHLFFLDGIVLLLHTRKLDSSEKERWHKRLLIFADSEFTFGAILDVMLSYFFLLDETADWDTALCITSVFSSVLWLHCSLIYMAVFIYCTLVCRKERTSDM